MIHEDRTSFDTLETPRMQGERAALAQLEDLRRLERDSQVMATLSAAGKACTREQTRSRLAGAVAHWTQNGFGLWTFYERDTGGFVGRAGLKRCEIQGIEEVELAYAVVAEKWGRGFGTEMARASLDVGFRELQLPSIVAFTLPRNRASLRILQKCGFAYERDIVHAGLPHRMFRVLPEPWRTASAIER